MSDDYRDLVSKMVNENPEYVEKYGNPLDDSDPRNWSPTRRREEGLSVEDRLKYLELNFEVVDEIVKRLSVWYLEQLKKEMLKEMQEDPAGFLTKMLDANGLGPVNPNYKGDFGPNGDNGPAFAGSTKGIAPDTIVDSINGPIRADQIPGYKNEPDWRPSPDWIDANCTCPVHTAQRAANNDGEADGGFGDRTGFYL